MSESLESLKKTKSEAPYDATHVSDGCYLKCDHEEEWWCTFTEGHQVWELVDDVAIGRYSNIRSLSDILEIIELREWKLAASEDHQSLLDAYLND